VERHIGAWETVRKEPCQWREAVLNLLAPRKKGTWRHGLYAARCMDTCPAQCNAAQAWAHACL
jgi:hypothetical protein